jgi:hypothetical protein
MYFFIATLFLGIVSSLPGIALGKLLAKRGVVDEVNPGWLVGLSVACLFIFRLALPGANLAFIIVGISFAVPLSMYRGDLWEYVLGGKARNKKRR